MDLAGYHLCSHPAFANQETGADELIHCLAHGGPGQVELCREVDLVVQAAPGFQDAAVDRGLDALDHLVVEGHWRRTIDAETELVRHWILLDAC